jgi:hypothetical protein
VLNDGLKAMPSHPQLLWDLANLLLDGGNVEEAGEQITLLSKTNPAPEAVEYLQARVAIARKRWAEAGSSCSARVPLEAVGASCCNRWTSCLRSATRRSTTVARLAALERREAAPAAGRRLASTSL